MNKPVSIILTDEERAHFERVAEAREQSLEAVVHDALQDQMAYDADFRAAVEEGIAAFEAGDYRPWEEVEADLRKKFGDF